MPAPFTAPCARCGKDQTFEEFFRTRRSAQSARAARAGEYATFEEYRFRCTGCGVLEEKLVDSSGVLHKWTGNRHLTLHMKE